MKTTIFGLILVILLITLSLFVLPGCNKSSVQPTANKPISTKPTALNGKSTDTVATPPVQYATTPLTGDEITLVPHFYKSPTADSSYLYFEAHTKNSYCGTSLLHASYQLVNNNYIINFLDVIQPTPCVIGQNPVATELSFTQSPAGNVPLGTFPLNVTLNGTTYTGSIIVSSTSVSFSWAYTSGVLIAPQQISR
ncbi:MAG TPA: hypothetical protein VGN20_21650 [Mucilaginibacter sp.]|jgi:hypothetical protein